MGDILFLALRRLRTPLIVLVSAYGVSVGGLALIPGETPEGRVEALGFFHAFYIISYTATTIGFGEVPYPFTQAQRAWLTLSIYLSVIAWTYTLGSVFALVSSANFRAALARGRFRVRVRRIDAPFFLLAGYGQSNAALAHTLDDLGYTVVVVESRAPRAERIEIEDFVQPPLFVVEDARWPEVLQDAGLDHPHCVGAIVQVGDDAVAQAIAIGASVLAPHRRVLVRVHTKLARANLEPFPGVTVLDPFETFATNLRLGITAPAGLWVEEWLTGKPGGACPAPVKIPRGHWVIVGHGRFGQAVTRALGQAGVSWTAVDPRPLAGDDETTRTHVRQGDDSDHSLVEAGIREASGFVAATDQDAINLALVSRARRLHPRLFVAIRQNHAADRSLITAAKADLTFVQSEVMLHECLQLLVAPSLNRFLMRVREEGNAFAERLIVRLLVETDERVPHVWTLPCLPAYPGLRDAFERGPALQLEHLMRHPLHPDERLKAVPLLVQRGEQELLMPAADTAVQPGDRVLFAGGPGTESLQRRFLFDPVTGEAVRTGVEPPRSWVFRKLAGKP